MRFIIITLIATTTLLVTSCSSDSDTLMFEQAQMLKLKLIGDDFNYKIEGNEVNEIGYFYTKRKIEGYKKILISGVNSSWDHAPIKFRAKFIYRGEGEFRTTEILKEGIYGSGSTEGNLQINLEFFDERGIKWSTYPEATSKNQPNSHIEILDIEPRYSPVNGSRKEKVNLIFQSTFYNALNESLNISGKMTAVLEQSF